MTTGLQPLISDEILEQFQRTAAEMSNTPYDEIVAEGNRLALDELYCLQYRCRHLNAAAKRKDLDGVYVIRGHYITVSFDRRLQYDEPPPASLPSGTEPPPPPLNLSDIIKQMDDINEWIDKYRRQNCRPSLENEKKAGAKYTELSAILRENGISYEPPQYNN